MPRRYIRSPGTGRPPSGPPKTPQSCFDIDRSRSEAYLQERTLHPSSPETTKPSRMDTQEAPSEQEWRLVGSDQRLKDNITVVMKFTDGTALGTLPPDTIGNSVLQAAGLNSAPVGSGEDSPPPRSPDAWSNAQLDRRAVYSLLHQCSRTPQLLPLRWIPLEPAYILGLPSSPPKST